VALVGAIVIGLKADNTALSKGLIKGGKQVKAFGDEAKGGLDELKSFAANSYAALDTLVHVVGALSKSISALMIQMAEAAQDESLAGAAIELQQEVDDVVGQYVQMKKAAVLANEEAAKQLAMQAAAAAKAARTIHARLGRAWHGLRGGINSAGNAMMSFKGMVVGLGAAVGVGLAVDKFKEMAVHAANNIAAQDRLAKRIGTTTEEMSALEGAYRMAMGTDEVDGFRDALSDMQEKIGDVTTEAGGAAEILKLVGLNADQMAGQDAIENFKQIADKVQGLQSQADKLHVADTLFSGEGQKFLPFLEKGRKGIEEMQAKAKELGLTVNSFQAAEVIKAQQAMQELKMAFEGFVTKLVVEAAPVLTALVDEIKLMGTEGVNSSDMVTDAIYGTAEAVGFLGDMWRAVVDGFRFAQAYITKGLAWIASGITKLFEGIDAGLMKVGLGATGLGESLRSFSDGMHAEADQSIDEAWQSFISKTPSEKVTSFMDRVAQGAEEARNKMEELPTAMDGVTAATLRLAQGVEDLEKSLKEQIATFGMSSAEADIFKLKMQGATDEQLASARAMAKQIEQMEKQKEEQDRLKDLAKSVFDETRTPLEKYQTKIEDLKKLFDQGLINSDTFDRAVKQAKGELGGNEIQFSGPMELGSNEARSVLLQNAFGGLGQSIDPQKDMLKTSQNSLKEQREQTVLLRRMVGAEATPTFAF